MRLNKTQFQQTETAILHAFDRDALRRMLRRQLDEDLDVVAGDDELATVVFNLVTWAERNGRVSELIAGALAENPNNAGLKQLTADYRRWESAAQQESDPALSPGQSAPRRSLHGWLLAGAGMAAVVLVVAALSAANIIQWPWSVPVMPPLPPGIDTATGQTGEQVAQTPGQAPPGKEPATSPANTATVAPTPTPAGQRPVVVSQTHTPRTPTAADMLTIQGAANDADGNLADLRIIFDGAGIALCNDPASPCAGTVNLAGLPSGAHSYQVVACDYDGLCSNNPAVAVQVEPAPLRIYAAEFGGGSMEIAISDEGGTTTCLDIELWLSAGDVFRNGKTLFMYLKGEDGSYTPLPRPHEYVVLLENDSYFTPKFAAKIADVQANCPYISVPSE